MKIITKKKLSFCFIVLFLTVLLTGCDVLFGSGDTDSKYGSSSSSDSSGTINNHFFSSIDPVNGANIATASTHFKWNYSGDTSKVMFYFIYINGSRIDQTNIGGSFYDIELYNIISGEQNSWFLEAVDTNWNTLARSENFSFNCDASGGTNDMPSAVTVSQYTYRDEIEINWNSPMDSAKLYKIYGERDGKKFVVATNTPWIHPFHHYGLVPDMSILYAVASVDWNNKENLSGWYTAYTAGADYYKGNPPFSDAGLPIAAGETIYFKFNLSSRQRIDINLHTLSFNGAFIIYDDKANYIHEQNSNFDNSPEFFNIELDSGDYFIAVKTYSGAGSFSLDVTY